MKDAIVLAAEAALAEKPKLRTVLFTHDGERYIAKRLASSARPWWQTFVVRWLAKSVTGQALPLHTLSLSSAARSVAFEANRLHALFEAGVSVPQIVARTETYMVLQHCGTDVATLLEGWQQIEWRIQLVLLARDLGAFHLAGQWHGGAQIKNVTLQGDNFSRIDFEETFGEFLPLPVAQTIDLISFLNSVSLAGPIREDEARYLLPVLIDAYFAVNRRNEANIRDVITRALPKLVFLVTLIKPLRRFSRKSLLRAEIMVDVLRGIAPRP